MKINGIVRSVLATASLLLLAPLAQAEEKWVFTTFAGVGPGSLDGVGRAARFYAPRGLGADPQGAVFVADLGNRTIRRINRNGVVSTFAGVVGQTGDGLGPVASAAFATPQDAVVDKAGNVFVADTLNYVIRKITTGGTVEPFVGLTGVSGSKDGQGSEALFVSPTSLAIDKDDNIYVADEWDGTIRKVTPAGVVTTLAGKSGQWGYVDATGSEARFDGPLGIAVDGAGNVYVADVYNVVIRKITPAGAVTTFAGKYQEYGTADGPGSDARFYTPVGIAVGPDGNIYVGDQARVRRITPEGVVTSVAGDAQQTGNADGPGSEARFDFIYDVAVDADGNVYLAEGQNHTIRKLSTGGIVTTFAGVPSTGSDDGGPGTARFNGPEGLHVDGAGSVIVADKYNHAIRFITSGGEVSTLAGRDRTEGSNDGSIYDARFSYPSDVTVGYSGELYVSDQGNGTIRKIDGLDVTTFAGSAGQYGDDDGKGSEARFQSPAGIVVDQNRNVFVVDRRSDVVRKITEAGDVTTFAGVADGEGTADGTGADARFNGPAGLAIDSDDNLYVTDMENHSVRRITPAAEVSTWAGVSGEYGEDDGPAAEARFVNPWGIGIGADGSAYVTEMIADVRRIDPARNVTRIGGEAYEYGSRDGVGTDARFQQPSGIDVGPYGILYVADFGTNTIRRGVLCEEGALCSLDGRFQITLVARNGRNGETAPGVPLQQNDLFGYFSLPGLTNNPGNPEVFVKMLDGRPVNGSFWVFYGGLTDFEYTLTVKDKQEGTVKTYTKADGTSNGGFDVGGGVAPEVCNPNGSSALLDPVTPAPCAVEDDNLCLTGGRFKLELEARDPRTGATGPGASIPQGDLFGYFALPSLTGSASNPEVFVKMLDGRPVNGRFWIFYSGLTDLEYSLTVTDTVTGARKRYTKAGGSACGAFDVSAFE